MVAANRDAIEIERLLEHVRVLCDDIGPRPPTSAQERRAADYARKVLEAAGIDAVEEQFFTSAETSGWMTIPYLVVGTVAPLLRGRGGKLSGGLLLLGAARGLLEIMQGKLPSLRTLVASGISQNISARIPPSGEVKRRVVLCAHLDTDKPRFLTPNLLPALTKPANTTLLGLLALAGVTMLVDAVFGRRRQRGIQRMAGLASALALAVQMYEESQPHVEGANGDASGVAVALALAQTLMEQPLETTEVTILLLGSQETGGAGIDAYLRQQAPPVRDTTWIALQSVGSGRLCYITGHGVSYASAYHPGARITPVAARVARERGDLRVQGRDVLTLDVVAPLRLRGYEAIAIAGCDETGHLPHWRRATDTLATIESDTLARAAAYTLALVRAIDGH